VLMIFFWEYRFVTLVNRNNPVQNCTDGKLTNQRFSKRHQYLPAEKMKEIGRCRGITDDPIYLEELSVHNFLNALANWSSGLCSGNMSAIVIAQLKKPFQSRG